MALTIICHCGKRLAVTTQHAGKVGRCPNPQCRARIVIPPAQVVQRLDGKVVSLKQIEAWLQAQAKKSAQPTAATNRPAVSSPAHGDSKGQVKANLPIARSVQQTTSSIPPKSTQQPTSIQTGSTEPAAGGVRSFVPWAAPEITCAIGVVLIAAALFLPWFVGELSLGFAGLDVSIGAGLNGFEFRPEGIPLVVILLLISLGSIVTFSRRDRCMWALGAGLGSLFVAGIATFAALRDELANPGMGCFACILGAVLLLVTFLSLARSFRKLRRVADKTANAVNYALAGAVVVAIIIGLAVGEPDKLHPERILARELGIEGRDLKQEARDAAQELMQAASEQQNRLREKERLLREQKQELRRSLGAEIGGLSNKDLLWRFSDQSDNSEAVVRLADGELMRRISDSPSEFIQLLRQGEGGDKGLARLVELLLASPNDEIDDALKKFALDGQAPYEVLIMALPHLQLQNNPDILPVIAHVATRYFKAHPTDGDIGFYTSKYLHSKALQELHPEERLCAEILMLYGDGCLPYLVSEYEQAMPPPGPGVSRATVAQRAEKRLVRIVRGLGGPDASAEVAFHWANEKINQSNRPAARLPEDITALWGVVTSQDISITSEQRQAAAEEILRLQGRKAFDQLISLLEVRDYQIGQHHRLYAQWAASRALASACSVDFGLSHEYWQTWFAAQPTDGDLRVLPDSKLADLPEIRELSTGEKQSVNDVIANGIGPGFSTVDFHNYANRHLRDIDPFAIAQMADQIQRKDPARALGATRLLAHLGYKRMTASLMQNPPDSDGHSQTPESEELNRVLRLFHSGHIVAAAQLAMGLDKSWQRTAILSAYYKKRAYLRMQAVRPDFYVGFPVVHGDITNRISEFVGMCGNPKIFRMSDVQYEWSKAIDEKPPVIGLIETPELVRRLMLELSQESAWGVLYCLAIGEDPSAGCWIAERTYGDEPLPLAVIPGEPLFRCGGEDFMHLMLDHGQIDLAVRFKDDSIVPRLGEILQERKAIYARTGKRQAGSLPLRMAIEALAKVGPAGVDYLWTELRSESEATREPITHILKQTDGQKLIAYYRQRYLEDVAENGVLAGPIENSIGMSFVQLPTGSFTQTVRREVPGRSIYRKDVATVKIEYPFWMSMYEVTQTQYKLVMGQDPSNIKGKDLPVHNVTWADAVAFCDSLSKSPAEVQAGRRYVLPTEQQWEYAARANKSELYFRELGAGWSGEGIRDYPFERLRADGPGSVGQLISNPWGLFDMGGNVREWTASAWSSDELDSDRVIKGCSYTGRISAVPLLQERGRGINRDDRTGFRVVCLMSK